MLLGIALSFAAWFLDGKPGEASEPTGLFSLIMTFFLFMPSLTCSVRRLHDQNKSGWWWLINFIPLGFIIFIYFMFCGGSEGANDYGDDPLSYA
jgi:uncharacterized membrane protein YhaH (DUF805 family)